VLGILLIDKPLGITSHDVVNTMRRRFSTKRVGHAGTLDPMATGLLVVAVGAATRFLQYLPLEPKEYEAEITFGVATTTQDREGEVVSEQPVPDDLAGAIAAALPQFRGLIQQIPPMYSAVKKGGKALYVYARRGEEVEREPRTVHIGDFAVLRLEGNTATCRIVCSGGTYVRTLAHDLGEAIGCGAFLSGLRRTHVGRFSLDGAVELDDVDRHHLLPLQDALPPVPLLQLDDVQTAAIRQGRQLVWTSSLDAQVAGLLAPDGSVVGMARVAGNLLQPECVIPSEAPHGAV
jgi:tRNA pseudouridine55 synthase